MANHPHSEETTRRIQELHNRKAQLLQEVEEVEQELGEVQVRHDMYMTGLSTNAPPYLSFLRSYWLTSS
jgi:hypothetical protein